MSSQGVIQKTRNLISGWKNDPDERTSLLGNDSPKKTSLIATAIALIIGLIVLILTMVYWFKYQDKNIPPPELTSTERDFLDLPSKEHLREYLQTYTSKPHLAGTPNDKQTADWTHAQFESFGLNSSIETYWPLLSYPVSQHLALISGPKELRYKAKLTEDDVDPIPTYHGFSKNGTVTGKVVYANYGRLEDFEYLKESGVKLKGTIALVRYGYLARGHKVFAAANFGCVGVLIYSDPIDDGPIGKEKLEPPAKSYPDGPWRSKSSVQRGNVLNFSLNTGDPLTPGYAATKDAKRIDPEDAKELPSIPSLPLSWEDALPLLKATQGHGVHGKDGWAGGLQVDYSSGPTEGEAILVNHVENKITPIWNVIGRIQGADEPDRAIILGNHRDAWVYGAADPSSGSSAMVELARTFGILLKRGWRPRRTIIFASWDAEEFGLIGSTEWVEDHKKWLVKNAAAYINVDAGVKGAFFNAGASPSLNRLLYETTSQIQDPLTGDTVYNSWSAGYPGRKKPPIRALGSGSDFVAFLSHVGIASMNLQFAGYYGVYHSNYDNFHWMETFGDPGFEYHQTLVKIWGLITLRLADNLILPIYPQDYTVEIGKYIGFLQDHSPSFKNKPLRKAYKKLRKTTRKFELHVDLLSKLLEQYSTPQGIPSALMSRLEKVNTRLTFFERGFISSKGLPGRTWFKHTIYAPGLWTGYSSQEFPGIVDSLDQNNHKLVKITVKTAAKAIKRAARILKID